MIGPATLATLRVAAGARAPIVGGDWSELPSCAPFRVAFPVTGLLVRHFHGDAEHARFLGRIANTTRSTLHRTMTTAVGIAATAVAVLDFPAAFPLGGALIVVARRAVQLGMRGKTLARYAGE